MYIRRIEEETLNNTDINTPQDIMYMWLGIESYVDSEIWHLEVNNVELLAGMLAVGMAIVGELNRKEEQEAQYIDETSSTIIQFKPKESKRYYLDSDTDVTAYRLVADVSEEDMQKYLINLSPGIYAVWINSEQLYHYSLYIFTRAEFLQGVVSVANNFSVDFRNYIYGVPFDGNGNQYILNGYEMHCFTIPQVVLDLDDIDEENRDNENEIEPLRSSKDV